MQLTGPQKAVLLLLSLDESVAGPVVAELSPDELRHMNDAVKQMDAVPADTLGEVYRQFVFDARDIVALPRGGASYLKKLAARVLGDAGSQAVFTDEVPTSIEVLAGADPGALASLLSGEHAQVVAAILSQMEPARAGRVIDGLPDEARADVLSRLAEMTEISSNSLDEVARALASELPGASGESSLAINGVAASAAVVRSLNRETGNALLGDIDALDHGLASQIRKAMYGFEDLKVIDPKSMRELLKMIAGDKLALALKTASEELRGHLFQSMSRRAADLVREDLEMMGAARLSDVEAAQHEIVEIALRLEAEGAISLGGGEDDAFV